MPVASDTARAIGILGSLRWATGIARARQCRLELSLDHRLDELAHPIAQADFDRIKPIVEKMDRRLGLRLQGCRVRAIAGHGVVSTGAQTPGLLGFQHPETTPPSIPTTPRTAPQPYIAPLSSIRALPFRSSMARFIWSGLEPWLVIHYPQLLAAASLSVR